MGRVFRLIRGDTDLPLSGGPGTLRAMYYKKSGKKYKAVAGDCYIQAVEWSPDKKVNAWSIHQYGSATKNKTSAHYDDQAKMFSKHKMKVNSTLKKCIFILFFQFSFINCEKLELIPVTAEEINKHISGFKGEKSCFT